jgi:Mg/Co/Ni transporter MgtE
MDMSELIFGVAIGVVLAQLFIASLKAAQVEDEDKIPSLAIAGLTILPILAIASLYLSR